VSWEKVEEASWRVQRGEEVPMPTLPPLFKKTELSGLVEVAHLEFAAPDPPPPMQVPCTAQQPAVRLTPLAKLEVAADEEKRAFAMVVEACVMENKVVVAYASELEPMRSSPATEVNVQCLASVPAFMSVRVI
jgi:hypothetical protein